MGNNRVSRHALALTMLISAFLAGGSTSSHAIAATNNVGLPVIPLHFTNEINSVSNLFTWIFGVTNQDATGIPIKSQVYQYSRRYSYHPGYTCQCTDILVD